MSDYYKSLITDEEVIKELIKESKRRDGKLPTEATRMKPNLNFFQRTVNNLISNNTRIDKSQDTFKTEFLQDCNVDRSKNSNDSPKYSLTKSDVDYAFEREFVLQNKVNFVKSSEKFGSSLLNKKKIEIKKIHFQGVANSSNSDFRNKNANRNKCVTVSRKSRLCYISNDSVDRQFSNSLVDILNNEEQNTTCKTTSVRDKKRDYKIINGKSKNDVIYISSDDSSVEMISSVSEDKKIKSKVKPQDKKRKKKSVKDKLDEKSNTKVKRKKNKKKKKRKGEKS